MPTTDRSPCCDARLVLVSPPLGYECRECLQRHDLAAKPGADAPSFPEEDGGDDAAAADDEPAADVCGAETSDGSPCQNDPETCPHH